MGPGSTTLPRLVRCGPANGDPRSSPCWGKGLPGQVGQPLSQLLRPPRVVGCIQATDPAKPPPPAFASGRIPPRKGRFRGPCPRSCLGHGQQRLEGGRGNSLRAVPPHVALGSPPTQHGSKAASRETQSGRVAAFRAVGLCAEQAPAYLVHRPMHCSTRPV
jgi:hypothetical protein